MAEAWAWRQSGRGPDLVMLHGWGMQSAIFAPLAESLAPDFRVTALDLPGHGRTPCAGPLNLASAVDGLLATLAALDLQQPAFLGWSLGGQVGLALAHVQPRRLSKLILVGATPRFVAGPDWPWGMAPAVFQRFAADLLQDATATLKRFLALQTLEDGEARKHLRSLQAALLARVPEPRCLREALEILRSTDLRASLATLDLPVLLMQGGLDRLVAPATAAYLLDALPQARLLHLPGVGHAPFLSAPETCAAAIRAFLADAGG
ncbi:pimeloyl-ACP methyl ester esterase BioH [Thermithiobacillus tepidarius DSM 3134]|uniref:pimeloyl-ACP methyl ester esterase BioH n=1 Tax=Thermithiobacillus tepidarius TaxID=929 RepID=UPI00048A6EDA|nr:pimeloyl-ACP methyl ester esterase BioH [Thermithiobacillus tepidarius]